MSSTAFCCGPTFPFCENLWLCISFFNSSHWRLAFENYSTGRSERSGRRDLRLQTPWPFGELSLSPALVTREENCRTPHREADHAFQSHMYQETLRFLSLPSVSCSVSPQSLVPTSPTCFKGEWQHPLKNALWTIKTLPSFEGWLPVWGCVTQIHSFRSSSWFFSCPSRNRMKISDLLTSYFYIAYDLKTKLMYFSGYHSGRGIVLQTRLFRKHSCYLCFPMSPAVTPLCF